MHVVNKNRYNLGDCCNIEVSPKLISKLNIMRSCLPTTYFITKTHVRGFFDPDLHEVSWHFATQVLSSNDRVKINVKEAIQNGFLFLSHT